MDGRFRWLIGLLAIAMLGIVGVYTYNLGVAHGVAESAALAAQGTAPPMVMWPGYWHRGFWFMPFGPLFFILFWLVVFRGFVWRRHWHGHRYGYDGVPPAFDEWHRRAHARPDQPPSTGAPS